MTGSTIRWPKPSTIEEGATPDEKKARQTSFWQAMVYLTSLGWLMALPIAGAVILGRYLDDRLDSGNSWTLALLGVGITVAGIEAYLAIRRALQGHNHG